MVMNSENRTAVVPCLLETWHLSESQLYHWLLKQSGDAELSFDLLQETFLRALQRGKAFCDIENQRAWLYRVASNLLVDELRKPTFVPVPDDLSLAPETLARPAVDSLAQCLPKALLQLSVAEREIIQQCDLAGMAQQTFANTHHLTLPATKSRIQRARKKLKQILKTQCHIRFDEQQRVCCFYSDTLDSNSSISMP